jgi:hypothetical protein
MSIQAITSPPPALLPAVNPDQRDSARQQQNASQQRARPGSAITITRVDKQDYPDGYVVITTTYENKTSATKSAPKSAPPPLVASPFDPRNGGQLSTLLAAQEGAPAVSVAAISAYRR